GLNTNRFLAVDLDHNSKKEIVVAHGDGSNSFSFKVYNADGSLRNWPTWTFPGKLLRWLMVADLDGDGKSEIIAAIQDTYSYQVLVLMPDGSGKPGWPVTLYPRRLC